MRVCTALLIGVVACGPSSPHSYPAIPLDRERHSVDPQRTELERTLDRYIEHIGEEWGEAYRVSGYVHMVRGSTVLYSRGFGYADRQTMTPNTADTSFRIGSVTKQFTAAAILVLEQQGLLSVDDPISKHLPDYPAVGADVTIHQLLTHTSGIPSYTNFPEVMASRDQPRTVAEVVKLFSNKPLEFPAGEKFAYSNSGYFLLGAIIEAASGASYAEFLDKDLFGPAGLSNTKVGDRGDSQALGYEPGPNDELQLAQAIDMSVPYSAGAIRSTASDLVRWHRALRGNHILTAQSKRKLMTPDPATGGAHYAYGWHVDIKGGKAVVTHGGGIDGFSTEYTRLPDDDLVIVVLLNNTGVESSSIAAAALAAAQGKPIEPFLEPKPTRLSVKLVTKLVGSYRLVPESRKAAASAGLTDELLDSVETLELSRTTHGLTMKPNGQPPAKLHAIEGGAFYNRSAKVRVEPELAADGSVTRLRVSQGALSLDYAPQ